MVGGVSLSDDDPRSPYQQIADDLRSQIESGLIKPGQRLPSTRELMERYEVANQTVQSAMRILRGEDLVHSVAGRGIFVREDISERGGGADAGSPEFKQVMDRLDSIVEGMTRLDDRLTELEAERTEQKAQQASKPKPRSTRPAR